MSAAGAPSPSYTDGLDLMPALFGKSHKTRSFLHGEHSGGALSNHYIVTEKDKYIWYSQTGKELYFALQSDRKELHNRIQDDDVKDRVEELRTLLIKELNGREEGYTDGCRLISGRKPLSGLSILSAGRQEQNL